MQLVLSNNRIIAHGENFLAMGGVVINNETGAKFENATVAECEGCPSDIDKVGYEYHAGVFVPCAPFGMGDNNGYVMEVCEDCATPRNSGIPIKEIKWQKLGSITERFVSHWNTEGEVTLTFPVSDSVLSEFKQLRYVIKKGSKFLIRNLGRGAYGDSALTYFNLKEWNRSFFQIRVADFLHESSTMRDAMLTLDEDIYSVVNFTSENKKFFTLGEQNAEGAADASKLVATEDSTEFFVGMGNIYPTSIKRELYLQTAGYDDKEPSEIEYTLELEGRK